MDQKEIKDVIFTLLDPYFKSQGFKMMKGKNSFIKKIETGFLRVSFGITDYDPEFWIRFALSIRHDEVAEVYNRFADRNPATFSDTVTVMVMQGDLENLEEFHYVVFQPKDVELACKLFVDFMTDKGMNFFHEYGNLNKIDQVLNSDPMKVNPLSKRELTRAMNALIIARKIQNPRINELFDAYRELVKNHDQEDKDRLEQLIKFLSVTQA